MLEALSLEDGMKNAGRERGRVPLYFWMPNIFCCGKAKTILQSPRRPFWRVYSSVSHMIFWGAPVQDGRERGREGGRGKTE